MDSPTTTVVIGRNCGQSWWTNSRKPSAPSSRAASSGSAGMDCSPITNSSAFTPAACQVVATIIISVLPGPGLQPAGVLPGQAEEAERLAERAVGLQHEAPDDADGDTRDRVRQQERQPQPGSPPVAVGQYGDQQAERDRQRDHPDHPQQRVDQRSDQVGVAEHRLVVGQPGPDRRPETVEVGEADVRRPEERQVQQQRDHARGRQPEQRCRPPTGPGRGCGPRAHFCLAQYASASAWIFCRPGIGSPGLVTNAPNTSSALFTTGTGVASNQRLISR